ncbi:MAG: hypothetical protein COB04_09065 [Gammaproteobacteria bacterium]|nr:MAG: hypothetical protein COB04_09065 [Gammaproteobacteria bacterium]
MKFDSFVSHAGELAEQLINSSAPDDIAYLQKLQASLRTVVDIPKQRAESDTLKNGGASWTWSTVVDAMPLYGIQLNLTAGAALPTHDHRGYIGLVLVLEGQLLVKSYNLESIDENELLLSDAGEQILSPGESIGVPLKSANIHTLQDVGGGSRIFDMFTFLDGNGAGDSHEIDITEEKNADGLIMASYTGRIL